MTIKYIRYITLNVVSPNNSVLLPTINNTWQDACPFLCPLNSIITLNYKMILLEFHII